MVAFVGILPLALAYGMNVTNAGSASESTKQKSASRELILY
jgi:hypothetical protein